MLLIRQVLQAPRALSDLPRQVPSGRCSWLPSRWLSLSLSLCLFGLLAVAWPEAAHAQSNLICEGNINLQWRFGRAAGLDFTSGAPVPTTSALDTAEGVSSVSDAAGDLLFYTDGITVWNRNDQPMPNGTGLFGDPSSTQSGVIFPMPGNPNQYYIFTADSIVAPDNGINYSIVDMTQDTGLGDVISKNISLIANNAAEKLAAVAHSNGVDAWVVAFSRTTAEVYVFSVTSGGITGPVTTNPGGAAAGYSGEADFSPDGTRLAIANTPTGSVFLFDFNPATGAVTNKQVITGIAAPYGVEFSPNSQLLYVSNTPATAGNAVIRQFNLAAGTPTGPGDASALFTSNVRGYLGMELGPDGQLYIAQSTIGPAGCPSSDTNHCPVNGLDVLGQPDVVGSGANHYELNNIFALNSGSNSGLPNQFACPVPPARFDYSDAPNSYGTLLTANGPRHTLLNYDDTTNTAPLMLGSRVDAEDDAQLPLNATGDDANGVDDEDGVSAPIVVALGASTTVTVTVTNTTGEPATLAGWLDLDRSGTFTPSELVTASVPSSGNYVLTFPPTTVYGDTYARFRLFPGVVTDPSPTGVAVAGEVEDYPVSAVQLPWVCTPDGILVQDAPPDIYLIDLVTGGFNVFAEDFHPTQINAIGYNIYDNYLYGFLTSAPFGIVKIGADGSVQPLGLPPGVPGDSYTVGDIDEQGYYWLSAHGPGQPWFQIDLNPSSPTYFQVIASGTVSGGGINGFSAGADWAYVPGGGNYLYRVLRNDSNNTAVLMRFDRATKVFENAGNLGRLTADNGFGAVYAAADGFLYASDNNSGQIFRINVHTATATLFAEGPPSGINDGAFCIEAGFQIDFGDAPDSYGTTLANNGPRHRVRDYDDATNTAPLMLGTLIDAEDDAQLPLDGSGDDATGVDDEDGVLFNPALGYTTPTLRTGLDPVSLQPLENTLEIQASAAGFVSVWIDWNQDGDFLDAGEMAVNAQAVTAGSNTLTVSQGTNPPGIETYVRVRYSSDAAAISSPHGPAPDGEVEDYHVLVERLIQPDACVTSGTEYYAFTFSTLANLTGNGGVGSTARYEKIGVVQGVVVDMLAETIAGTMSTVTYPTNGFGIGNGVIIGTDDISWNINNAASIRYTFYETGTNNPVAVNGFFTVTDLDGPPAQQESARFSAADLAGYAVTQGSAVAIVQDGSDIVFWGNGNWNGDPQSRFQFVLEGISSFDVAWTGGANSGYGFDGDGDLAITPPACDDFGDAPVSYGTLLANNGARHTIVNGLLLGSEIDFEPNGQPSPNADGDDTNRTDDEDGVTLPAVVTPGQALQIPVQVVGNGLLNAWIDWNGDGDFLDAGEQIATDLAVSTGTTNLNVTVPVDAANGTTYARFRLSTQAGLAPTGSAPNGEVEDYRLTIGTPSMVATKRDALLIDADANGVPSPGDTLRYTIVITNNGGGVALAVEYTDLPDANTTLVAGSVTTSQGAVTTETPSILVNIGDIPSGGVVTIAYNVTIDNPLPAGVTHISNQGIVNPGNPNIPDTPTDDPDDPTPNDPTDTPITSSPVISAFKTDSLAVDADGNGVPSPGDTLLYNITIINSGNAAATGIVYDDLPDANTALLVGSVSSNIGTITTGNAAGDTAVSVDVGTLPGGGATVNISYRVTIDNPLPAGVTHISNQGIVRDNDPGTPDVPTDDPDDPTPNDPTDTPITSSPVISAFKTDSLAVDADGNGVPSPGDTLLYNITIINSGNAAATGIVYDDLPDANTALIVGSVTSNLGTITTGNTTGDTAVSVDVGTLPGGGATVNISYRVTIDNPLPAGVTQISNQGIVRDNDPGTPDVPTDDPDDPTPNDPTDTPITSNPVISAFKTDTLAVDADGNGVPSPGDTLLYNITIINSGNAAATGIVYDDLPDANTTLVVGSVSSNIGTITTGNNAGDTAVSVDVGTLPGGGATVNISYRVTIDNPLPAGVTQISNQGIVRDNDPGTPDVPTDDPDDPTPNDPTDTPITSSPVISAFKTDSLAVDADGNGVPSPGDTLLYNITIINSGNAAATGIVYDDLPDANTALIVGSVSSNIGTITTGNAAGDTAVSVDVGTLPGGGATVNISYRVTIDNPLPAGVTQISNQGIVRDNDPSTPDVPTDDPDDPTADDPTDTPITSNPVISAFKTDTLAVDADGNGVPSPGDTLLYNITIINSGNAAATGIVYDDLPDANTALIVGSVGSNLGTITLGNNAGDTAVSVDVGTLPGGGATVNISYRVTIDNPLPAGVTRISNQGIVRDNDPGTPDVPTDDPDDPTPNDPTDTPITSSPVISAFKTDTLAVDADGNGVPSPGDTLLYNITIINSGNAAATGIVYDDLPDANTALIVGSVGSNLGTITLGNNAGDTAVSVDVGTLPGGGATVNISYRVTIDNPLPAGVTQISNQGIVRDNDPSTPDVPTDDPDDPTVDDPTDTPVTSAALLQAIKRDTLAVDADGNGVPSPGDTLLYNITIINSGNAAATGVTFDDTPDANTALLVGSVGSNIGTITTGNAAGDTAVSVDVGTLPGGGATVNISYRVTIDNPLPAGVTQISNQGIVRSDNDASPCPDVRASGTAGLHCPALPTDDPDTPEGFDPTDTHVVASPNIEASKRDTIAVDADDNLVFSPGDTIGYNITLRNTGNVPAVDVVFRDTLDVNTRIVPGSITTSQGTVAQGNTVGETIIINVGTIPAGGQVTIAYRAQINSPLPAGVTQVSNQGIISGANILDAMTDDPDDLADLDATDTPLHIGGNPKPVTLVSFVVRWEGDVVVVEWETSLELDTFGFQLYRGTSGDRSDAVLLTPQPIPSQGVAGGRYQFTDHEVTPGTAYIYWLEEVTLGDAENPIYKAVTGGNNNLYLPLIAK